MRADEMHDWLAREAPPHTPEDEVDGIMAGDPNAEIRGVAVTWLGGVNIFATGKVDTVCQIARFTHMFLIQQPLPAR